MEKKFIDGLIIKAPREGAPEFVKANISIKRLELIKWLGEQEGEWVNANVLQTKADPKKWYAELDTWKPDASKAQGSQPATSTEVIYEDLPF